MHDLTAFQRDLLWVLAGKNEPHGLGIKRVLEDYYDKEVPPGRLYPNLDVLVDKGLVTKTAVDGRTNAYALRDHGRQEIKARCEWENDLLEGIEA